MPGAMLCRPCKAALKRARYLSVQDVPRASIWRLKGSGRSGGYQPGAPRADEAAGSVAGKGRRLGRAIPWLLVVVTSIGALSVAAYLGQQRGFDAEIIVESGHKWVPLTVDKAPQPKAPEAYLPAKAQALPAVPVAEIQKNPITRAPPLVPSAAVGTAPIAKANVAARRTADLPPRTTLPSQEVFADGYDLPAERVPAPAPASRPMPPPSPPPPDRWQTMSDALAQCARQGGFGGVVCDQRVRLQSCDGHWGRVAQCPNSPENPQGQ